MIDAFASSPLMRFPAIAGTSEAGERSVQKTGLACAALKLAAGSHRNAAGTQ